MFVYGCVFAVSRSSGTSSRGHVAQLNRACHHRCRDPAVHYWVCQADLCCHAWGTDTTLLEMSDDWCCLLFSVLLMALPQQLTFGISVFRSLHQREWPSRTDPNPQAPLSSLQVVRWKTKTFVCSSKFVTGALWPNSLHCFGGKYTNLVLKQFWLKEFNYAGAIILVAGCSVSCMPGFVLVTHQGQRTDGYWNTLCVWHCHTLLSAVLSLQAYAVQGQHAIPQPDVSEGPSVSDPIYLQLRSWEAMPPSYFIPLTLIFPATTAW